MSVDGQERHVRHERFGIRSDRSQAVAEKERTNATIATIARLIGWQCVPHLRLNAGNAFERTSHPKGV